MASRAGMPPNQPVPALPNLENLSRGEASLEAPRLEGHDSRNRTITEGSSSSSAVKVDSYVEEHPIGSSAHQSSADLEGHTGSLTPPSSPRERAEMPHLRDDAILHQSSSQPSSSSSSSSSSAVMTSHSAGPSSSSSSSSSSSAQGSHFEFMQAGLSRNLESRIAEKEKAKASSLSTLARLDGIEEKEQHKHEITELLANKSTKQPEALEKVKAKLAQIESLSVKDSSYTPLVNELMLMKGVLERANKKTFKAMQKDYQKIILPSMISERNIALKMREKEKALYSESVQELRALHAFSPDHLAGLTSKFISEMRSPQMSDFQSHAPQIESELCLEALKDTLLNPSFTHIDANGTAWKGGEVQSLSGGSGGVYALGLQNQEDPSAFKKLLVAKVVSEEPGAVHGNQDLVSQIDRRIMAEGRTFPYVDAHDAGADPIRAGIAPGKGVVNEHLASLTPFGSTPTAMSKIQNNGFKDPTTPQSCCLISFIESEGDFASLSMADAALNRLKLYGDVDEKEKNKLQQTIKKAADLGIEQGNPTEVLVKVEGSLDLKKFEDEMLLTILMRNQDAQAQNLLVVKNSEGVSTLKTVDNGATYSSIYRTNRDLPAWHEMEVAKQAVSSNPEMRAKIMSLNADALITQIKKAYAKEGLEMDIGQEHSIRASVALLKSSITTRQQLNYQDLANLTFMPIEADQGAPNSRNGIMKAVYYCESRVESEKSKGLIQSAEDANAKLDQYLLDFFEKRGDQMSAKDLKKIGYAG